jgi:hypothetical protein
MGKTVTLLENGKPIEVPIEEAGSYIAQGATPESDQEQLERNVREERIASAPGRFVSGSLAAARGLTLGLSDVAGRAIGGKTYEKFASSAEEAHPGISTAGQIGGAIIPAFFGDEAGLLNLTPAGFATRIGARIAEGSSGRVLGAAAAGAFEGAAQNAGSYVSDVALGNRDLSAEGFLGAMGQGALYGGVAGGALSVASNGLVAARRLFPLAESTPEAVAAAKNTAQRALSDSVETSKSLEHAGTEAATKIDRETQQFIADLEQERGAALAQAAKARTAEEAAAPGAATSDMSGQLEQSQATRARVADRTASIREQLKAPLSETELAQARLQGETPAGEAPRPVGEPAPIGEPAPTPTGEPTPTPSPAGEPPPAAAPEPAPMPTTPSKSAAELMKAWREKFPEGAVQYDAANAAARRQRLSEWAKGFEATTPEDETIKAYFSEPMDPMRTAPGDRLGGTSDVPKAVQQVARNAAADASHQAYLAATADAANVSKSGAELMARATYAGRKAAAQAMDDVYAAYKAGQPIIDIRAAATKKLTDQLHELAEARADMVKSLAAKPEAADDLMAKLQASVKQPKSLGERILEGPAAPIDPDQAVANALGKSKDVNTDIAELAPKISRYEAAKANLTEAIGDSASQAAKEHAAQFRAAQEQAANSNARATAQTVESVDKLSRGVPPDALPGAKPAIGGFLKKASDLGASYELLRTMGVPLPDVKSIPVIGPILSLFLKAKILSKVAGKFGGSFEATAEGTIAAKAAQTQNRLHAAIGRMLNNASDKVAAAAPEVGGAAALGYKLFDDGQKAPYSSKPAQGELGDLYLDRMSELAAAMQPGAIADAVKSRINATDPTIMDAIIAAETRRLTYLYGVAPKPDTPSMPGQEPRLPSKAEMLDFGNVLAASHDPSAVYERVAQGGVARDSEVKCINNCYPQLVAAAQTKLIETLSKHDSPLPYMRRIAISGLIGLPMDATAQPSHIAFLQSNMPMPTATPAPVPPPHPTLTASMSIGDRTLTRLDR